MKRMTIAAFAGLMSLSAASAADVYDKRNDALADPYPVRVETNWTGPYIAIGMGYEAFRSEDSMAVDTYKCIKYCTIIDGNEEWEKVGTETFNFDQFDGKAIVSGRIGYDQQRGGVVYGAFIEGNWLNLDSALGDAEWSIAPGARVGLLCGGALCYINGGWEFIELDGNGTIDNPFLGGGLEVQLGDGWGGLLEGRYSFRDDKEGGVNIKDAASGRFMLIKKLN